MEIFYSLLFFASLLWPLFTYYLAFFGRSSLNMMGRGQKEGLRGNWDFLGGCKERSFG